MNDSEREKINRHIHEKVMGKCWHKVVPGLIVTCDNCGYIAASVSDHLDYTSSKSPRYLLEDAAAKVAEDIGTLALGEALNAERPKMTPGELQKTPNDWHFYISLSSIARMTAEQIATAIYNATQAEAENDRPTQ